MLLCIRFRFPIACLVRIRHARGSMRVRWEITAGDVHVWVAHPDRLQQRLDSLYALLTDEEKKKADRYQRASDRARSIVARGVLRSLLSQYTGDPAAQLKFNYTRTGKPFLSERGVDVGFNVSHSGNCVLLAFGKESALGIDVEQVVPRKNLEAAARRYFSAEECQLAEASGDAESFYYQLWTRKEAFLKAQGGGVFSGLASMPVSVLGAYADQDGQRWYISDLDVGEGYASAMVVNQRLETTHMHEVEEIEWDS